MTDPGVQLVREWLRQQPFSLRLLTLFLFTEEAVMDEFGEDTRKNFAVHLRAGLRELPHLEGETN